MEEKLLEAKYFIARMMRCSDVNFFAFDLNAYLAASRSVAFLIRKELGRTAGFRDWWAAKETEMNANAMMSFFRDMRNFSQKEGRVRLVGHGRWVSVLKRMRWEREFVSGTIVVPPELRGVDVIDACRVHLARMAALTLECAETFPFHACPRNALTPEGVAALGLDLDDVDEAIGLPRGWTDLGRSPSIDERTRLLRQQVDGVDFYLIAKLAQFKPKRPLVSTGADDLASALSARWLEMRLGADRA